MTEILNKINLRNYTGFIQAVRRIRNPRYDDETSWTRMQRLLASRIDSFAEPHNARVRNIVHEVFVVRRTTFFGRLPLDESDSRVDKALTTPLKLRERRVVCQVLPHLENILPVDGAAPFYQGILTWKPPPVETRNDRVLRQTIVESVPILEAQFDELMCPDTLGLSEEEFKSDVEDSGPLATSYPELDADNVVTVTEPPSPSIGIRDYLDKLPF